MTTALIVKLALPLLGLLGPLTVLMGLPGTWLTLALAGTAEWVTDEALFDAATLIGCLVVAVLGEVWEFSASSTRAKRAGAGRRGSLGALGGGILGAILGTVLLPVPLIGSLLGGAAGAFGGATLLEHRGGVELGSSLRIGRAAAAGHFFGLAGKFVGSIAVWLCLSVTVWV